MDMYKKRKIRAENKKNDNQEKNLPTTSINWYPGHMQKTKRLIKENINLIDLVYEVIDARIPYSSKIIDIDDYLKGKPKILIMTKIDLCDLEETNKWIKYYQNKGMKVVKVDLKNKKNINEVLQITEQYKKELDKKRLEKNMKPRKIRILITGIPNVGKSTLINCLVNKKAVNVGNKPGVTKSLDWIRINDKIELLDTPGILWPKFTEEKVAFNLASLTAIKEEVLPLTEVVIYILKQLEKYYPDILKERYKIDKVEDLDEALTTIGKNRGCLIKGGMVDYEKVYSLILNDVKNGNIKNITFDRYE